MTRKGIPENIQQANGSTEMLGRISQLVLTGS